MSVSVLAFVITHVDSPSPHCAALKTHTHTGQQGPEHLQTYHKTSGLNLVPLARQGPSFSFSLAPSLQSDLREETFNDAITKWMGLVF